MIRIMQRVNLRGDVLIDRPDNERPVHLVNS